MKKIFIINKHKELSIEKSRNVQHFTNKYVITSIIHCTHMSLG